MRHQVFELPRIEPLVTEYVRLRGVCRGCGQKHHGALPAGVPSGQLGPRALALVGTLAGQFHLTQRKVQDVLSHIMGIRFSLGTVSQAHGLVSQALAAPVAQLHAELQHAPVCHADETRHQSHGHTMWMWVLASDWGVRLSYRSLARATRSQAAAGRAAQLRYCQRPLCGLQPPANRAAPGLLGAPAARL
jgi:transposase